MATACLRLPQAAPLARDAQQGLLQRQPSPWICQRSSGAARPLQLSPARQRASSRSWAPGAGRPSLSCAATSGNGSSGSGQGQTVGVVVVDHGSRKAESNDMLLEFVELYKRVSGRQLVEVAHMELAEPTVEQAVGKCAAAGAQRVIIAPYFLSRGRHIQHDIPALAADAAAKYPELECVVAEPIGIDALMAQLIENRVQAAEAGGAAVQRGQGAGAAQAAGAHH